MTTSLKTLSLSKPQNDDRIPRSSLAYFQSRNRHRIYETVVAAFLESGLTQAELARRLGKGTDQVCRWLGAPGNWGLDTVSDLAFAINGGEIEYSFGFPLDQAPRNMRRPVWADGPTMTISAAGSTASPGLNMIRVPVGEHHG